MPVSRRSRLNDRRSICFHIAERLPSGDNRYIAAVRVPLGGSDLRCRRRGKRFFINRPPKATAVRNVKMNGLAFSFVFPLLSFCLCTILYLYGIGIYLYISRIRVGPRFHFVRIPSSVRWIGRYISITMNYHDANKRRKVRNKEANELVMYAYIPAR